MISQCCGGIRIVLAVSHNRITGMGKLHTDLVMASGVELDF